MDRGGRAIVQDPATAESPVMPLAAVRVVPEAAVVPLDQIAPRLIEMVRPEPAQAKRAAG